MSRRRRAAGAVATATLLFALAGCPAAPEGDAASGGVTGGGSSGSWAALGAGPGEVSKLVAGPGGVPYAVGYFGEQGGSLRNRVARWDGAAWVDVSAAEKETTYAIAVHDDGSGPAIYAIVNAGDYRLCKLGAAGWERLGDKFSPSEAMQSADLGGGPLLFAAGGSGNFSWWDGEAWTPPFGGFLEKEGEPDQPPSAFAAVKDGAADVLYLGGPFERAGPIGEEVTCNYVARWDGTKYSALGTGLGGEDLAEGYVPFAQALCVSGSDLYVGGLFTSAGGTKARSVARWDGAQWHALGAGVEGEVRAIAALGGKIYVAGDISRAGDVEVGNIAVWDGEHWIALGAGVDGEVHALLAHEGALIVGGNFRTAGDVSADGLAKWTP